MKMILMGKKSYCGQVLEWSLRKNIEILGVVTNDNCVVSIAKKYRIPVISIEQAEQLVKKNIVDIVVSYLYWKRIREPLISGPRLGCINFHPAILPDWRGMGGYNIAILNKLEKWGATAHYVDSTIDTGNIIRIFRFDFDFREETAYSLEEKTQKIQVDLYKSVMLDILNNGRIKCEKQDSTLGTYVSKNEMEQLKKIDIEKDDIDLKIRAFWFPPYDGANIVINNQVYTLINKEILSQIAQVFKNKRCFIGEFDEYEKYTGGG